MKIALRFSASTLRKPVSRRPGHRAGFGLVEVIVAMILLAVAVSALASLSYSVSQSSLKVTGTAFRNGIMMQETNRLVALPYDSLHVGDASYSVSDGPYQHTRVITVAEQPSLILKTVRIVLKPVNPRFKWDTVTFTRTKAKTTRVLNTALP